MWHCRYDPSKSYYLRPFIDIDTRTLQHLLLERSRQPKEKYEKLAAGSKTANTIYFGMLR